MQLVLHAPFGSRVNKAWGLALRKRFCRQFNFELQAAATDDALMLSLGPQHSFPLSDVFRYLHPETARDVLVQAFLDAPMFETRWRWNSTLSLAVPRNRGGRKVPPQVQRMLAADLLSSVFPDAAACLENIPGDREIPDHPLVNQTVRDCLEEAMDIDGLLAVLTRILGGELQLVARDTPEPSVLAHEILNARPYAFLDDAPLEERRSHAVQTRRAGDSRSALGALDLAAIDRVRDEQRANPRDADELHDALVVAGFLCEADIDPAVAAWLDALASARRACRVRLPSGPVWVAAERLPEILALDADAPLDPPIDPPRSRTLRAWTRAEGIVELLRSRLTVLGPATAEDLARTLATPVGEVDGALLALESEGVILRGRFTPSLAGSPLEWCDRALLARIHRYTLNRLRAEIEPVSPADFMRFLFKWQHVDMKEQLTSLDGLREALAMLDGFELPAAAWERSVLPARVDRYDPAMLDMLCLAGEVGWARLSPPSGPGVEPARLRPATPVALFVRERGDGWLTLRPVVAEAELGLTDNARRVLDALRAKGASFFSDLRTACGLDADATREALGSLVASGLAASDGFSGLRALLSRPRGRPAAHDRRARFAGRWTALAASPPETSREKTSDALDALAWTLLHRYGVVFRRVVARESLAAPWRDLARVYRRLEAQGDIRGGRFVSGMSGEQFALPHAVERLREIRRTPPDGRLLTISTADPLNLAGIVTAGDRVRVAGRNRLVYRDGVPLAVREGEEVRELATIESSIASDVARALGRPVPRALPQQRAFAGGR
jgi:ATP-dependent Lhr-like helicase